MTTDSARPLPLESPGDDELSELLRSGARPRVSEQRSAAIVEHCTKGLAPRQSATTKRRVTSCMLLCLVVTLGLAVLEGHPLATAAGATVYGVLGWASLQLGLLAVGLGRAERLAPWHKAALVGLVPVGFFLFLGSMAQSVSLAQFLANDQLTTGTMRCGAAALAAGALASGGIMFVWRRTDPFNPGFSGSVAGLVGGLAGALAVGLACQEHASWHLWLSHGVIVVGFALAGGLLGRRWLAP